MSRLRKLEGKKKRRVARRKKHYHRYVHLRNRGRRVRAKYQLGMFRRQKRAIKKLNRLISAAKDRIEQRRKDRRNINWNGKTALTHKPLLKSVRTALSVAGLYITSTSGGTHSSTSWHYQRKAVDFGSNGPGESPEIQAQELLLRVYGASYFAELFGPANWYVKNGVRYTGTFPGHSDHLHCAVG